MFTRSVAQKIRAEGVMKAMDLPSSFPIEKYLTKALDYDVSEHCVKSKNGAKYRKVNKVEYTLTTRGLDKLSYLTQKCNIKCINDFMTTSLVPLPVVYLFIVVNDEIMKLVGGKEDHEILVKYGYTNNLPRRMNEHLKTYGSGIILKYHVYVDPSHLKDAENEVRDFFHAAKWHVMNPKYSELALVPKEYLGSLVASEYKRIGESYLHKVTDMCTQMDVLKREVEFCKQLLAEKERTIGLALTMVQK